MATRQAAREALVTLFTAAGAFNQVNGYAKTNLQGFTKVLNVYTRATSHDQPSKNQEIGLVTFMLDVFVLRADVVADENTLDSLHETIRAVVKANQGNAAWEWLQLGESDAYFSESNGKDYRLERHPLTVKLM